MDKPDFPISGELKPENLPAVFKALAEDLPEHAIRQADGKKTGKGYDMTGYPAQYAIDRMNEVLNGHWHFIATIIDEPHVIGKTRSDRDIYEMSYEITAEIGNWRHGTKDDVPWSRFEPLARAYATGGHDSVSKVNVRKGAMTNALKRALAFFGVGAKAYRGELDEDYKPPEQADNGGAARQDAAEPTTDHPDSPPRQSDLKVLSDSLISTCSARELNRHLVMVSAFGVMSSKALDAKELSSLLTGVQEDKFAACALAVGEDGEPLKPKEQYLIALVSLVGKDRQLHGLPATSDDVEKALEELAKPYERTFAKLTVAQLKEVAQKVADAYRAFQLARARIRPLAMAWRDAMRKDVPESTNDEAAKTFRHFCAIQFKKEPIDLTNDDMGQVDDALSAGKVDVLKGEIKQVTPAEVEGEEEEIPY